MGEQVSVACALCQHPLVDQNYKIEQEDLLFCCKGCHVVYHILKAQQALGNFRDHPVFKQATQSGLIANPNLQISKTEEQSIPADDFQKIQLMIQNMWCPSCAQVIHLILIKEKGVRLCVVDYATDLAVIEYTPRLISKEKVLRLIQQLGYQPQFFQDPRDKTIDRTLMLRFIVAAFFALNVMMFAYPIYATYFDGGDTEGYATLFAWLSLWGSIPVVTYCAWPIWRRFYTGLRVGIWGMEALVCLGVIAATCLSFYELYQGSPYVYFDSITVIIMFVLLGKMIESKAKFSAKDALVNLTMALPRRGRKRLTNGLEDFVPIKDISPGDKLIVLAGEKIVLDGIVEEGSGSCDESLMTGESLPVIKKKNSLVIGGTILQQGNLVIKVTSSLEHTALNKILEMVGKEINHKSRYVRAVDKIVKWFVPLVVTLSLLTALFCYLLGISDDGQSILQTAFLRSVAILLISCPCAIGIAAPLAESYLLNILAKMGMIVRNRGCLEYLGKETVFVFDKTGTVTEGCFTVLRGLENLSFEDKMALKGIVSKSLHPISVALHASLLCPPISPVNVEEVVGSGMRGIVNGSLYCLGSKDWICRQGINLPIEDWENLPQILTSVYLAKDGKFLTNFLLGDRLREGVEDFIHSLSDVKSILISGDASTSVAKIAKICGFDHWYANQLPAEKKIIVEQLRERGELVAMLGDGINDAPALTASHIGIAVASASEMSIQVSDILLTTYNFHSLQYLRKVSAVGRKIIRQNLFWAFFYNCIGIGFAMVGLLTPLFAAFAMVISSLIVLFNAQRISRFSGDKRG